MSTQTTFITVEFFNKLFRNHTSHRNMKIVDLKYVMVIGFNDFYHFQSERNWQSFVDVSWYCQMTGKKLGFIGKEIIWIIQLHCLKGLLWCYFGWWWICNYSEGACINIDIFCTDTWYVLAALTLHWTALTLFLVLRHASNFNSSLRTSLGLKILIPLLK